MKIVGCILILSCLLPSFAQTNLLPVAKNGRWGLVNENGQFKLDVQYEFIEYVPNAKQFIYDFRGKKGVISYEGKMISPPTYEDIVLFDTNSFAARENGKWNLFKDNAPVFTFEYDSIRKVLDDDFALYKNGKAHVYFGHPNQQSDSTYLRVENYKNVYIKAYLNDSIFDCYSPGKPVPIVPMANKIKRLNWTYEYIFTSKNTVYLSHKNGFIQGRGMSSIQHQYGFWFYCIEESTPLLFSAKDDQYYPFHKMDYLVSVTYPLAVYNYAGKQGVWNLEKGTSVIDPKFEGALPFENDILVTNFGRYGIINSSGKTILPIIYQSIDSYDNCYVVLNNGKYGIMSLSGIEICPAIYTKIGVYNNTIKCYINKDLVVFKLDDNGAIKDKKTYSNYMSVQLETPRTPRRRSSNARFGGQNTQQELNREEFGWFRPVLTTMKDDSLIEYRGNWGLKDSTDSIYIRPQFKSISTPQGSDFTKAYRADPYMITGSISASQIKKGMIHRLSLGTLGSFQVPLQLVNHKEKKLVSPRNFQSVQLEDFNQYALARAYDISPILIDKNGKTIWNKLTYYDAYQNDILLICSGGTLNLGRFQSPTTICPTSYFFENLGCIQTDIARHENYIEIEDGEWYYINKYGKQMNDTAFQVAHPFEDHFAIVQRNNKWGVIDTGMNIIVPIIYAKVDRIKNNNKTYFSVKNEVNKNYIYSKSSGELMATEYTDFENYYEGKWFARQQGNLNWALVDTNLNPLTDFEYGSIKPFEDGWANVVKAGKKTILNTSGTEGLPFYKSKRIESLGNDLYAIVSGRGMMLINGVGDTLIPENDCKRVIESTQDYVIYEDRARSIQLLNLKNEKELPKKSQIIGYSLQKELFLLNKGGKTRLYSLLEEKYISKELDRILAMGNDALIYIDENGLKGLLDTNADTICHGKFEKLEFITPNIVWGEIDKMRGPVDKTGEFYFKERVFRIRPLGNKYIFSVRSGSGLINEFCEVIIPPNYFKIEVYNSKFYKCHKEDLTVDIFTLNGNQINDRSFKDIKAIEENFLIVNHDNFDYLYNGVLNKSLAFQGIAPISTNLYHLRENGHFGIYSEEGKIIVPVRYHRVEFVGDKLQVSFFNSFGFYKSSGETIFDPYEVKENF